jgi:hypothetical protein
MLSPLSASTFFYSLIQTVEYDGHKPYWFLRYMFEFLPIVGRDSEKLRALLLINVPAKQVTKYFER